MIKPINSFRCHEDPGHAYLEVTLGQLLELGVVQNISGYSYIKEDSKNPMQSRVFLEEDCDYTTFIEKHIKKNGKPIISSEYGDHRVNIRFGAGRFWESYYPEVCLYVYTLVNQLDCKPASVDYGMSTSDKYNPADDKMEEMMSDILAVDKCDAVFSRLYRKEMQYGEGVQYINQRHRFTMQFVLGNEPGVAIADSCYDKNITDNDRQHIEGTLRILSDAIQGKVMT